MLLGGCEHPWVHGGCCARGLQGWAASRGGFQSSSSQLSAFCVHPVPCRAASPAGVPVPAPPGPASLAASGLLSLCLSLGRPCSSLGCFLLAPSSMGWVLQAHPKGYPPILQPSLVPCGTGGTESPDLGGPSLVGSPVMASSYVMAAFPLPLGCVQLHLHILYSCLLAHCVLLFFLDPL